MDQALAGGATAPHKAHRPSRNDKKKKNKTNASKKAAVAKPGALSRRIRLSADRSQKRASNPHLPTDRTPTDAVPAPRIVAVVGPAAVGKSTLIRNLVKHYSKRSLPAVTGPVTLVAGKRKRITLLEVGPSLPSMIDAAKVADLVLLVIDASFGFEMETFEFLNVAAAHGMPKVIAVLTHLDKLRDGKQVRNVKKTLKARIWAELYDGAKVFYLSGITTTNDYLSREILNLARFISVSKTPSLRWRSDHTYLLADRVEDISPANLPPTANRTVAAYGYVRGTALRPAAGQWQLHLAGVADLVAANIQPLSDPCPPPVLSPSDRSANNAPDAALNTARRKLSERERVLHAPMAPEVDGIAYDRDAVYIDLNPANIRFSEKATLVQDPSAQHPHLDDGDESSDGEGERMVKSLQKGQSATVDDSLNRSQLRLVEGGKPLVSENFSTERRRRPALFDNNNNESIDNDSEDDESDDSDDDNDSSPVPDDSGVQSNSLRKKKPPKKPRSIGNLSDGEDEKSNSEADDGSAQSDDSQDSSEEGDSDISDEGEEDQDEEGEEGEEDANERTAQKWKENMLKNAAKKHYSMTSASKALQKFIYDKDNSGEYTGTVRDDDVIGDGGGEESDDDGDDTFFRPRRKRTAESGSDNVLALPDSVLEDVTRRLPTNMMDWISNDALCARLKRKRWGTGQRSDSSSENENADDGGEADGDFEDLETGEVQKSNARSKGDEDGGSDENDGSDMEAIKATKMRQKARFNAEWDQKGSRDEEDSGEEGGDGRLDAPDVRSRKAMRGEEDREPDFRKLERERLDKVRNEEMQHLDAEARIAMEGLVPGRYVRMELQDVPVEFVKYFDPNRPIVLGGLRQGHDEGHMMLRARVRRHRFKRGVLKSNDPVVFSIGWRRFQSMPIYDVEDAGGRHRFIKYTPEFLHCNATMYGPRVGPGAGVVMCQSFGRERGGFRIAATGVVTEVGVEGQVMKKLKLVGEAASVHRNTAFIKGMFNSEVEASKYIGAAIRTVSGIRGTVKKAVSEGAQRGSLDRAVARAPAGTFRAGFEDRILLSDIVFLRAWVEVEVEKFCSVAGTLLEDVGDQKSGVGTWRMRTVREVREEGGMSIPLVKDSLYKEVERGRPVFQTMRVPKAVEGALPFASKGKAQGSVTWNNVKAVKKKGERKVDVMKERAIVVDGKERKERQLLHAMYNVRKDKLRKRKESKASQLEKKKKEWGREEMKREEKSRARSKRKYAMEGVKEARDGKRQRQNEEEG